MDFLKVKSHFFQNFFSRIGCTAKMAAHGLGGWNFEEIQFMNRGVMWRNFQEASLKTVDFPQDELFETQKSKFFPIFLLLELAVLLRWQHMAQVAETLRKYSFWIEEWCVKIFRRLAWKLWISHKMNFLKVKNQIFFKNFLLLKVAVQPRWQHKA